VARLFEALSDRNAHVAEAEDGGAHQPSATVAIDIQILLWQRLPASQV
jgi:hypothetical protein